MRISRIGQQEHRHRFGSYGVRDHLFTVPRKSPVHPVLHVHTKVRHLQGFGIAVGSDLYFLLDPRARAPQNSLDGANIGYSLQGVFHAMNGTIPITLDGQWTFSNQTATEPDANDALFEGNIACARNPEWQWWRQNVSPYALIALVPIFSLFLCLNNLQPIRSRQLPVMIIIACIGFVTNTIANRCKLSIVLSLDDEPS